MTEEINELELYILSLWQIYKYSIVEIIKTVNEVDKETIEDIIERFQVDKQTVPSSIFVLY